MTLSEMKKIAAARTKGKWKSLPKTLASVPKDKHIVGVKSDDCLIYTAKLSPECIKETHDRQRADASFIAMAANNWDKIIARLEALEGLAANTRIMFKHNCAQITRDIVLQRLDSLPTL